MGHDISYTTSCLGAFPVELLNTKLAYQMSELLEDHHSNWWGGVVHWLEENNIKWHPLERERTRSIYIPYTSASMTT